MKLSIFFRILRDIVLREFNRRMVHDDMERRFPAVIMPEGKYYSVVTIEGDCIGSVLFTCSDLYDTYRWLGSYQYDCEYGFSYGIVYHLGKERLRHKKVASCRIVCLYGYIFDETLRALSVKRDNFY